jgi:hypothetical protein
VQSPFGCGTRGCNCHSLFKQAKVYLPGSESIAIGFTPVGTPRWHTTMAHHDGTPRWHTTMAHARQWECPRSCGSSLNTRGSGWRGAKTSWVRGSHASSSRRVGGGREDSGRDPRDSPDVQQVGSIRSSWGRWPRGRSTTPLRLGAVALRSDRLLRPRVPMIERAGGGRQFLREGRNDRSSSLVSSLPN